ncbi:MAG: DUF89 family protein [Chloroflexi bacterium]|nr:DUF89 family protein [Chloroflexota bacterium]
MSRAAGQPAPALAPGPPDVDGWRMALSDQPGRTWHDVEWFFAETYLYRVLMDAVDYFVTRHDPFGPIKAEEYASEGHRTLLDQALSVAGSREEVLNTLLGMALWGNRVDLSYAESRAHGGSINSDDLLIDDRSAAIAALTGTAHTVHVVADNAGSEAVRRSGADRPASARQMGGAGRAARQGAPDVCQRCNHR